MTTLFIFRLHRARVNADQSARYKAGYLRAAGLFLSNAFLCILLFITGVAHADSDSLVEIINPISKNELWINPGFTSYHFDQSKDFNALNYGIGGEYRFSSVASVTAGTFRNSNYHPSTYIGAYWQPIALGPIQMGFVGGIFNGYTTTNNGGWFPAVLPALTMEGDWVGLNLIVIPTIPNRVSGSLSIQLKLKVLD